MAFPDLTYNSGETEKEVRDTALNAPTKWKLGTVEITSTPDPYDVLTYGASLSSDVADGPTYRKAKLTFTSSVPRPSTFKVTVKCNGLARPFRVTLCA